MARLSLPSLRDWPTAAVPTTAQAGPFPALGWQLHALRASVSQALACPAWLEVRLGGCWGGCTAQASSRACQPGGMLLVSPHTAACASCSYAVAVPHPAVLLSGTSCTSGIPHHKRAPCRTPVAQARLQAARYAHLPVASMGPDWAIDAADALFARQLRAAGHLLWVSSPDATTPGSGLATRPPDRAEALLLEEQRTRTEVTAPGVYRTVCCEVKLTHLAVNAVLEVREVGGGGG